MLLRRAPKVEACSDAKAERTRKAPLAPGRRKARRRLSLVPVPAVLGAVALVIAGGGSVVMSAEDVSAVSSGAGAPAWLGAGVDGVAVDASARTDTVQVSRSATVSRQTLDRQTQVQAEQREAALAELAEQSEERAGELLQQERAERRAQARVEAEDEAVEQEVAANQWVLPLAGYTLTAQWGETSSYWSTYHTGLDFAAASGTPLVSVARGEVTYVGYDGAYGNKTEITLEDGTVIWYAHQTSQTVSVGQVVDPGELIGYVGATGNVTGPHLHLEVQVGGQDVDPVGAFTEHGVTP